MYLNGMHTGEVAGEALVLEARMREIIDRGRSVIAGTALTNEQPLKLEDVATVRRLLGVVAPITVENFGLHDHVSLSHRIAWAIMDSIEVVAFDRAKIEVVALIHDFGRFVTHRFGLTDVVGKILLTNMGFRQDVIDLIPNDRLRLASSVEELTTPLEPDRYLLSTMVVEVADLAAKRDAQGRIRSWWDSIQSPLRTRGKGGYAYQPDSPWLPEAEASKKELAIQASGVIKLHRSVLRYIHFAMWLGQWGSNIDDVIEETSIQEVNQATRAIIFDIGGVVVQEATEPIVRDIADAFETEPATITDKWADLIPQIQTEALSEADFWQLLAGKLGKSVPVNTKDLFAKSFTREPDQGVVEFIKNLKQYGYTLVALSDTGPSHAAIRRQDGIYDLFDVVAISPEIGVNKQGYSRINNQFGDPTLAFKIAALRAGVSPSACVFIDDKEKYVKTAEQIGMKGVQFEISEGADMLRLRLD